MHKDLSYKAPLLRLVIIVASLILIFSPHHVRASVDVRGAKSVFLNFQKLVAQRDDSSFGAKFRDLAGLSALECFMRYYNLPNKNDNQLIEALVSLGLPKSDVKSFIKSGFGSSGAFSSPSTDDLSKLCPMIETEGFKAFCKENYPHVLSSDSSKKYSYLPYYLVLKSGKKSQVLLGLSCAVSFKEVKTTNGSSIDLIKPQEVTVGARDIEKLESPGVLNWSPDGNAIFVTAQSLPKNWTASSPIRLLDGRLITDVKSESLILKIKSLPKTFVWTLVIEP